MNDIVSIRKIRPLPSAEAAAGTAGAAVTCGGNFFFGGKVPSLPANEFFTTLHHRQREEY
jgi:hypothetical protein